MKETIKNIIKHNSVEEATNRIMMLLANSNIKGEFTIDDLRNAFEGGRRSVEPTIGYEPWGNMEEYAKIKIVKSFKQWMHENYRKFTNNLLIYNIVKNEEDH